jgi:hypothetical protein
LDISYSAIDDHGLEIIGSYCKELRYIQNNFRSYN